MKNLAITLGTAAALVASFLLVRAGGAGASLPPSPGGGTESRAGPESPAPPAERDAGQPATVAGLSELEALHRAHGKVGGAMRDLLAVTRGSRWIDVDRGRVTEALHAVRSHFTEADIPYLLDLFNRTQDSSFRWWFSWLVQQAPDARFVDAMTEVYRLDPHRGIDALASINSPFAMERSMKLMDVEPDPGVRLHAITSLAHSAWAGREEAVSAIAKDEVRAGAERIEALTALGRVGISAESLALLVDVALGPKLPVVGLTGHLAASHPIPDVRSGAVLAIMQRGDQETLRRLIESADARGPDSDLTKIVDPHVSSFLGPDISELIYDRARRRGFLSAGEVSYLVRDLERVDLARLRDLVPLVRDADAKALLQKILSAR